MQIPFTVFRKKREALTAQVLALAVEDVAIAASAVRNVTITENGNRSHIFYKKMSSSQKIPYNGESEENSLQTS